MAKAASYPSHQREADGEQEQRAFEVARTENTLAGEAQDDGGDEPDGETGTKQADIHNMN